VLLSHKNTNLDKESKILLNQIRTIDKKRLIKRLGNVDENTLLKVEDSIKLSLGLK